MVETLHGKFLFFNAFFAVQNKESGCYLKFKYELNPKYEFFSSLHLKKMVETLQGKFLFFNAFFAVQNKESGYYLKFNCALICTN